MADLDFSHKVSEIPAGETLPKPISRSVSAEVVGVPDAQAAINKYAADTNWMSALGSEIASRSSNAIAAKLGSELGKNPQGELGPSITDFDKNLKDSYATQAQSTLSLQAQKLITDSNIELATAPRITGEMIAKKQNQVNQGLQKIYSFAPDSIKPSLEHQYGSVMMQQNAQLVERMVREQREDMGNNAEAAAKVSNQNAHSLALNGVGLDANGDSKPGLDAVKSVEQSYASLVANKIKTPVEAKIAIDSARQSYLAGRETRKALIAEKEGKLPEFYRNLANSPPKDISDADHLPVINNVAQYMNMQESLRTQDQQLKIAQFKVKLAENPDQISGSDLANLQADLTPLQAQQVKLDLVQALNKKKTENQRSNLLMADWGNPELHANSKPEDQTKAFNTLTTKVVNDSSQSGKNPVSKDMAEVQVAASAGAPIPVFIKTLNNKLTSGSPQNIQSASDQIQALRDMDAGRALTGLSKQAEAIAIQFQHQRGSMPDSDLARKITDNIMNIDESMQKTLDNAWSKQLAIGNAGGLGANKSLATFALDAVNVDKNKLGGGYFQTIYGNDLYQELRSNFDTARGDYATAVQMTKDYYNQRYGETRVNGSRQISDSPIEKALGYDDPNVVPFIHEDMLKQMNVKFEQNKNDNDYWTTNPVQHERDFGIRTTYPSAEITRHIKTDKGMQEFKYPVNLIGRPGGKWDVVVQTPNGPRNLFLVAPHLGIITFTPNQIEIKKNYSDYINRKGWF